MYLHCTVVLYLGKSHGAADLFIKGKIAVPPRRLDVPNRLTSEGMCWCGTACSSVPYTGLLVVQRHCKALWRFSGAWLEPWAVSVLPEGRALGT